jgi:GTPase SAR1 family protein
MYLSIDHQRKIALLKNLIIDHEQFDRAYQTITNAYWMNKNVCVAQNIICVGQSGTGKSTLKEKVKSSFPRIESDEKIIIPILVVDTPSMPTVKNIAEEMLIQLGDPKFDKGSAIDKTNRILNYIELCEVNMIIFDELQHFIDHGKNPSTYKVSEWLKTIIDKAKTATVLMGLERSEQILRVNEQLRRRFSKRIDIFPFDIKDYSSRNNFKAVIHLLDEKIDLPVKLDLSSKELITALFFATDGIIDYLVKLFIGAYECAVLSDRIGLDKYCFEKAFLENIWIDGVGKFNPFNSDFINERLNKPGMPFNKLEEKNTRRVSL